LNAEQWKNQALPLGGSNLIKRSLGLGADSKEGHPDGDLRKRFPAAGPLFSGRMLPGQIIRVEEDRSSSECLT